MVVRVAVLADTHVRDTGRPDLPPAAWRLLATSDRILHAGDVVCASFLDRLERLAPVCAVRGNNDVDLPELLETAETQIEDVRVAMIHDTGPRNGRTERVRRRFPTADLVVFGHSHIPWNERGPGGPLLFNPGSATTRRRQPHRTMGMLVVDGDTVRAEVMIVDDS